MITPDETVGEMREARDFLDGNKVSLNLGQNFDRPLTQIEVAQAVAYGTIAAKRSMEQSTR